MGLFGKKRKDIILESSANLMRSLLKEAENQYKSANITDYQFNVIVFVLVTANELVSSFFEEGAPMYNIKNDDLGVEGNALNGYYTLVIALLFIHENRLKNKKELAEVADVSNKEMQEYLSKLLRTEDDYVTRYINILWERTRENDGDNMEVFHQEIGKSMMLFLSDKNKFKDVFSHGQLDLIQPLKTSIYITEASKALDKNLGL